MEEGGEKKKKKKRKIIIPIIILLSLFLMGAVFILKNEGEDEQAEDLTIEESSVGAVSESPKAGGEIFEDSEETSAKDLSGMSQSENYKINQIRFGGSVALADEQERGLALELSDIKSEMVISRENEEPKFLLSWKTNKASVSEVVYAKDDGGDMKTFRESDYGLEHSVSLSDMELSTIYIYKITAKDRWGNEKVSDYFSMYTGEKDASIFDLIVNSIEETFSWALKK
ncbi:MAG: fibronectin type III domain-containing protein [Candidatus Moranbacteria bacterium]|jgi:hypothetical protein|nr:fibronectin type III domain-containing protein [Candidatus Moranbacteria bacterium]MDD5651827.1 fibronectin type III domain-containing protein [Candidatus Moranbacteria bacterium]MDX9855496.1 fibronectin type III domain-containing protein [Candidatus Moranbacteria bacterium]